MGGPKRGWEMVAAVGGEVGEESRRTASEMEGWKGPPWGECLRRCAGRTWPEVKKVVRRGLRKQMSCAPREKRWVEGVKAWRRGRRPQIRGSSRLGGVSLGA